MEDLSIERANQIKGGMVSASSCGYSIAVSATFGGIFGGAGAVIGAVGAATGPSCLGWW